MSDVSDTYENSFALKSGRSRIMTPARTLCPGSRGDGSGWDAALPQQSEKSLLFDACIISLEVKSES